MICVSCLANKDVSESHKRKDTPSWHRQNLK